MSKHEPINGRSSVGSNNNSKNTEESESCPLNSTDESEAYYYDSQVPKKQNKKSNLNVLNYGSSSSSPKSSDSSEESDYSFSSEGETFYYGKRTNALSREDRMRLSGRFTPDCELLSLTEQVKNKRPRKSRLDLSKEELEVRNSETARKRKAQAHMRAEEAKINTIHKLLRRQTNNKNTLSARSAYSSNKSNQVHPSTSIHYVMNKNETTLSIPSSHLSEAAALLTQQTSSHLTERSPSLQVCSVAGCSKKKLYQHSATGKLSCSYEHYKLLLSQFRSASNGVSNGANAPSSPSSARST